MDRHFENTFEFIKRKKDDDMMHFKKIVSLLTLIFISLIGFAQDKKVEMADIMRSNGRIYVVVAVVLAILIGLIFYMIRIDRKVTRLEKNN
jgi:hypothetical protein